ncbi:MAG: O-antigen ligase family protein [Thainema sp.]
MSLAKYLKTQSPLWTLLQAGFIVMPYVSYVGFVGVFVVLVTRIWQLGWRLFQPPMVRGLSAIAIGLIFNASIAFYRPEAFLQLTNFIPFFLLFAVLIQTLGSPKQLYQLAYLLVVTSIPMNLVAVFEYWLKSSAIATSSLADWSILNWFYRNDYGHRANSFFGHPNTYVSYLVVIFGLGLGLLLLDTCDRNRSVRQQYVEHVEPTITAQTDDSAERHPTDRHLSDQIHQIQPYSGRLLYLAIALIGVGIFCAGSRNGLSIGLCQLALFIWLGRRQRLIFWAGLAGIFALSLGALIGGIGGRYITLQSVLTGFGRDPRSSVWRIAWDLTVERPWFGWGLGNFKFLYPPRSTHELYSHVFHTHNFVLLMLTEAGVVLTLGLLLAIGYVCYRGVHTCLQQRRDNPHRMVLTGYLLATGGFILFSMLDLPFYDARINALNWLMLAGVYVLSLRSQIL